MTISGGNPTQDQPGAWAGPTTHPRDESATNVAKQQASEVASDAAGAGKHVAGVAGEQAQNVAGEATQQAKDLLRQTRSELTDQAATQQKRVASGLRALGDEFGSMARNSEQSGMATDLTMQVAEKTHAIASWLDDREPGHVLDEVTRFARRKPGTFLALAAGAGLVAGRLGRSLMSANDDSDASATDRARGGQSEQWPPELPGAGAMPPEPEHLHDAPPQYPPSQYPPAQNPPQPGYTQPGYPQQPGYTEPGYAQPGYAGQPGYTQQPGYSQQPGYAQESGYPETGYPPAGPDVTR
ncbi:hypothetical protein [Rhodococcus tibetensis]|uniref:DUF3618 domain-containing protein n=1 Tax=Rhodococcus tibetensis TaxID=2965064 RepID=A0ABT1QDL9_9NOCA|nr:hypothetical protein [Rhodococcus sp. FXJ9.536]MCQ4120379.1 hypothetical protein [Rhodococcus sp. FXJ9.536]